jgi:HEAT repeat protein
MMTMLRTKTVFFVAAFAALLVAHEAWAGRGGSYGKIASAIRSNNADVIAAELERAEKLVCGSCVGLVLPLLDHDDYRVREVAAWWIARRPFVQAAVVAQSVARLNGTDSIAARNAADTLGTFRHPDALAALGLALDRGFSDEANAAIVRAAGTIAHPAGEAIIVRGLAAPGPQTREAAALAYWALRGSRSGDPLAGLVNDGDVGVRRAATAAMANYKVSAARPGLETLVASDPDPIVRRNAAFALGRIGSGASFGVLKAAAEGDAVSYVRSYAAAALRNLH